jgi:hypothetical protein
MSSYLQQELEAPEEALGNYAPRIKRKVLGSQLDCEFATLNARAVEFIAKPGKELYLRTCMSRELAVILRQQNGFAGIFVLASHKEPRLLQVLTFWTTARQSTENHWEDLAAVRKLVAPLIDVCAKVHTYEAALPETAATINPEIAEVLSVRMC